MIKSDAQRERTAAQIDGFRQALAKIADRRFATIRGSYQGMIRQLEDEGANQLKSGKLNVPSVERLDQIAPFIFIAKLRIARGISQTELARRLG